ncbi:MAG: tripartite tricarboxylate transporter TctB family protein [Burkholderiales bacterium]|jgi:putative tricarboxylic transport membrane protein|nr:MAG: tripartite tricarboxylate transporter TctB family protein [Burkholderiales bacterium]
MNEPSGTPQDSVRVRWPEAIVAVLLQAIAIAVIVDSLRVGVGWADDGPRSGYFPFIIGVLLFSSATFILVSQLRRWSTDRAEFAERAQLGLVMQMAVPIALYVGAIAVLGLYVASIALISWFMIRHGKYRVLPSAAVAIGVPLICFLVFERWFLVPLPKGPLEAAFGF